MRNNVLGKMQGRSKYSINEFFKNSTSYFELNFFKPLPYYQPKKGYTFLVVFYYAIINGV